MIDMHSKYDNMHLNGIFNGLICKNNHLNSCINCMSSKTYFISTIWVSNYLINELSNESTINMNVYDKMRRRIPRNRLIVDWDN